MKQNLILPLITCTLLLMNACKHVKDTSTSFDAAGWQEEKFDNEALSKWQLLGKGSVFTSANGQTCLMESENSQGVMILSPAYYKGDVVVKYKVLALSSASVFVTILSATKTDASELNIPEDYDGSMGFWTNDVANYFIAFKNAPHGVTPYIAKNPVFTMASVASEQDRMLAGVYYDIEVGKLGTKVWLSVDGQKILDWEDRAPAEGGHIAFRLRGTAGLKASALIKDFVVYSK